jgi:small subunit ribosomal protein S5
MMLAKSRGISQLPSAKRSGHHHEIFANTQRQTLSKKQNIFIVQKRFRWSNVNVEQQLTSDDAEKIEKTEEETNLSTKTWIANHWRHGERAKSFIVNETVEINRHVNVTANGRMVSFSALVLLGDGKGTAGLGYGKAENAADAVVRATRNAERNLVTVHLFEDRTIPAPIVSKYVRSFVTIRPRPEGSGANVPWRLYSVFEAFGLKDVLLKTHGSRNKRHILRAIFEGIKNQVSPEEIAKARGKKWVNTFEYWDPKRDSKEEFLLD